MKKTQTKLQKLGDMLVGEVPTSSLVRRRNNFRRMSPEVAAALKANIERQGFQSLIVVQESTTPGVYEIIDGHHRWEAAQALERETVPVVVLKDLSKADADIAMLSFNVSADVLADEFYSLVRDIQAQVGEADLSLLTGLNEDFLKTLNTEAPAMIPTELSPPTEPSVKLPQTPTPTEVSVIPPHLNTLSTNFAKMFGVKRLEILIEDAIDYAIDSEDEEARKVS
jgi:hypothetical protein